jgi:hypothetical protein
MGLGPRGSSGSESPTVGGPAGQGVLRVRGSRWSKSSCASGGPESRGLGGGPTSQVFQRVKGSSESGDRVGQRVQWVRCATGQVVF